MATGDCSLATGHCPLATVELELQSAEMGPLRLQVSLEENRVSVHVFVSNESAGRRLEERLGLLRARLADMGVELIQFDVESGGSGNSRQSGSERSAESPTIGIPRLA